MIILDIKFSGCVEQVDEMQLKGALLEWKIGPKLLSRKPHRKAKRDKIWRTDIRDMEGREKA